ncbi:MAG: hypothetical protein E6R12_03555 [Sphingomonadales bacterium]|nr:MAG: hypothetical protein E6R12_03555 [Sphingomonadales bacterium]
MVFNRAFETARDHIAVRFNKLVEQAFDLAFNLRKLRFHVLALAYARGELLIPQFAKQSGRFLKQLRRRHKLFQQCLEIALHCGARNRLALGRASTMLTQIIRIMT